MKDRGADVTGRGGEFIVILEGFPRSEFLRGEFLQGGLRNDMPRQADRVGGDASIHRRRQVVRLNGRLGKRVGGLDPDVTPAFRP